MRCRTSLGTLALVTAALVGAGCQQGNGGPDVEPIVVPEADVSALVAGNNDFALALYGEVRGADGNLFLSPWSISAALGMTYAGARGATATQMAAALRFRLPQESLHPAFQGHLAGLRPDGGAYELAIANALWAQEGKTFLPTYLETVRTNYGAEARIVPFATSPEAARTEINDWVAEHTRGRIEDLFPRGTIDPMTRLALTNAIYFKGKWEEEFEERHTQDDTFRLADGGEKPVRLMHQTEDFRYVEEDGLQILELPYRGGALHMIVLLPQEPDGVPALEERLVRDGLDGWLGGLRKQEVRVAFPRFRFTSPTNPEAALQTLGMTDAFGAAADFSGMDGSQDLFIQAIRHKAFVQVDEEGTEAAAATGVAVGLAAAPAPPPVFRADRPFLFLIRDGESGAILFMGRLMEPVEE